MYRHILIPVALDHEGMAERKIEVARRLLSEGGKITLVTVLEDVPGFVSEFVTVKSANHLTVQIKERLDKVAEGHADMETAVIKGKPGVQVVQYARDHHVDMIIVGSQQPGQQDYFLGSTAARVARRAGCSVLIVR
jgi:nucleotide-binding universal stress UspA family protein